LCCVHVVFLNCWYKDITSFNKRNTFFALFL
jgi:hypothetical protein